MEYNSGNCRRCDAYVLNAFGVEKANGVQAAQRTRRIENYTDPKRQAGPYCRHCAFDRQREYSLNDRRTMKREMAEQTRHNVERNDCPLICAMNLTGKAYSTVRREARKLGWTTKRSLSEGQTIELIRRLGKDAKLTKAGRCDGKQGVTVRQMLNSTGTGKYAVIMAKDGGISGSGHVVAVDLDAPKFTAEDLPRLSGIPTGCSGEQGGRAYNIPGWTDVPAHAVYRVS